MLKYVTTFKRNSCQSQQETGVISHVYYLKFTFKGSEYARNMFFFYDSLADSWRRGVVGITTAQCHSTKLELRFCAGSNPACGVLEIHYGEDL